VTTPPRQGRFPEPEPEALEELARQAERAADVLLAENYPAP